MLKGKNALNSIWQACTWQTAVCEHNRGIMGGMLEWYYAKLHIHGIINNRPRATRTLGPIHWNMEVYHSLELYLPSAFCLLRLSFY